jgi:hypothetical protein
MLHTLTAFDKATKIQPAAKTVTGQYLSKNHLDARGRAKLAADLLDGRAILGPLTAKQIIALCRTKPAHVTAARDPGRRKRLRQLRLQRAWEAVDPDHRAEFCRAVGIENVWRVLAAAIA